MKEEIMNALRKLTQDQGIAFLSEEDAEDYYRTLVELIDDISRARYIKGGIDGINMA